MHFGFSYVGLIWLLLLFVPNFLWTKRQPENYGLYAKNESRVLLAFERVVDAFEGALLRYATRLTNSASSAEDVVQNAFAVQ